MRHYAHQVLNGILEADHFFALIFALDEQIGELGQPGYRPADEDFDASKWQKANPLMDVNPILEREITKAAADAKQMPGRHAEFKIKRLNRQAAAENTWLNIERWKRCNGPVDLDFLEGKECWAGMDGAATTDMLAFRLVWRVDGIVYTWGRRWVPARGRRAAHRARHGALCGVGRGGADHAAPRNVIDYAMVERDIIELAHRFTPKVIAYDPWDIRDLVNRLKADAELPIAGIQAGAEVLPPGDAGNRAPVPARRPAPRRRCGVQLVRVERRRRGATRT